MEYLFDIDWRTMFVPQESLLAMVIRGSLMYIALFALLRIFRRGAGSVSVADLLVIVIIADAAQNGMAGESKSVTEAAVLISTIIFWDYLFDWLGYKSKLISKVLEPEPLLLIKGGRFIRENMEQHLITEDELISQLRKQGIDDVGKVKECRLEGDGEFSVVTDGEKPKKGSKKNPAAGK